MIDRLRRVSPDFRRVLLATLFFGATAGIFASTLNNYLSDVHGFGAGERGWLELPRELPGFLIFFVMGMLLIRLRESRIAALAMVFTAAGALGLGFLYRLSDDQLGIRDLQNIRGRGAAAVTVVAGVSSDIACCRGTSGTRRKEKHRQ